MKTFFIDLLVFALIMVVLLVGMPRQKNAPLMHDEDVLVDRPAPGVKLHACVRQTAAGSGSKTFSYTDQLQSSLGTVRWQLRLTGVFQEQDGVWNCDDAQYEMVIYNTLYYKKEARLVTEGNRVTCILTVGRRLYGIPLSSQTYEIPLTCGENGTLS